MRRPTHFEKAAVLFLLSSVLLPAAQAQTGAAVSREPVPAVSSSAAGPARFIRAFVVDNRLSALRREPDVRSRLVQRLRTGRQIFIFGLKSGKGNQPEFYRVAVSRRTRGWLHRSAVAVPHRAGEDERVLRLAEEADSGIDRILLCRLLIDHFNRSPLIARAMLKLAEEAERASVSLSARARRRLAGLAGDEHRARDYYLNDVGLDRYSRLGIRFDFDEAAARYVYDGQAYRDIIRRFPKSAEAAIARDRLEKRAPRRPEG